MKRLLAKRCGGMSENKSKPMKDITTLVELREYLIAKGTNHRNYLHYTNFAGLIGMIGSGYFHLSKGDRMNDRQELKKGCMEVWQNTFIGSFAYGQNENMAMWGLYGLPWEDAVCMAIPRKQMLEWLQSATQIYRIENGGTYARIDTQSETVLTDVAYAGEPQDQEFTVKRYDETIRVTAEKQALLGINDSALMTGYVKNDAWHYENEVRLRINFQNRQGLGRIALRLPSGTVAAMTVIFGPWARKDTIQRLDAKIKQMLLNDNGLPNRESSYSGMVHYNTACRYCKGKAFTRAYDPLV